MKNLLHFLSSLLFLIVIDGICHGQGINPTTIKSESIVDSMMFSTYYELGLYGGFSSQRKIKSGAILFDDGTCQRYLKYDIFYKNTWLAGLYLSLLSVGEGKRPDLAVNLETSLYGVTLRSIMEDPAISVNMNGVALCAGVQISLFPIKAMNSYPSPFVFAGIGGRVILLSYGAITSSEAHVEVPFGFGVKQRISKLVSFQLRERFVFSTLNDAGGFILPETRFEILFYIWKK